MTHTLGHEIVDPEVGHDGIGGAVAGDFDGDGRMEFAAGGKGGGFYYLYDWDIAAGRWQRHTISTDFSPNVGAVAFDWDGDGVDEIVCGEWGPRLMVLNRSGASLDDWTSQEVWTGLRNPHDAILADVDGNGRPDVVIREKDGRMIVYHVPADPTAGPWPHEVIADRLEGDGTAAWVREDGVVDLVTNGGWFRNVDGKGGAWERSELIPPNLLWHPESRLAVADLDGKGRPDVVITESEITTARAAILRRDGRSAEWLATMIVDRDDNLGGLHSLQIIDWEGSPAIFTAEMENGRTDGQTTRPRWWLFARDATGSWGRHVLLDANLGTHTALAADYDGDGRVEIVGKVWRANKINGNHGKNHVDCLRL